jgi:hypothetical protein
MFPSLLHAEHQRWAVIPLIYIELTSQYFFSAVLAESTETAFKKLHRSVRVGLWQCAGARLPCYRTQALRAPAFVVVLLGRQR